MKREGMLWGSCGFFEMTVVVRGVSKMTSREAMPRFGREAVRLIKRN
jgi:hypothetical protein